MSASGFPGRGSHLPGKRVREEMAGTANPYEQDALIPVDVLS
jgi:hypothetical protein